MIRSRLLVFLFPLAAAVPLQGQDSVIVIDPDAPVSDTTEQGGLPAAVLNRLLEVWNDTLTLRLPGGITIPAGSSLNGRLAAFRGVVRIGGDDQRVAHGHQRRPGSGLWWSHPRRRAGGGRGHDRDSGGVPGGRGADLLGRGPGLSRCPMAPSPCGSVVARSANWRRPSGRSQPGRSRPPSDSPRPRPTTASRACPSSLGQRSSTDLRPDMLTRLDARGILRTAGNDSPFRDDFGYSVRGDIRFNAPRGFGIGGRVYSEIRGDRRAHPAERRDRVVRLPAPARQPGLLRRSGNRRQHLLLPDDTFGSKPRCAMSGKVRCAPPIPGPCYATRKPGVPTRSSMMGTITAPESASNSTPGIPATRPAMDGGSARDSSGSQATTSRRYPVDRRAGSDPHPRLRLSALHARPATLQPSQLRRSPEPSTVGGWLAGRGSVAGTAAALARWARPGSGI